MPMQISRGPLAGLVPWATDAERVFCSRDQTKSKLFRTPFLLKEITNCDPHRRICCVDVPGSVGEVGAAVFAFSPCCWACRMDVWKRFLRFNAFRWGLWPGVHEKTCGRRGGRKLWPFQRAFEDIVHSIQILRGINCNESRCTPGEWRHPHAPQSGRHLHRLKPLHRRPQPS